MPGGPGPSIGSLVGSRIVLTTTYGERTEGEVFAYDKAAGVIVLKRPSGNQRHTLQFINESYIKNLEDIQLPSEPTSYALPALRLEEMKVAAEKKLQVAEETDLQQRQLFYDC